MQAHIFRPTDRSINQPTDQSNNQSIKQSFNQTVNQSINTELIPSDGKHTITINIIIEHILMMRLGDQYTDGGTGNVMK
jgi:hypothetical protein